MTVFARLPAALLALTALLLAGCGGGGGPSTATRPATTPGQRAPGDPLTRTAQTMSGLLANARRHLTEISRFPEARGSDGAACSERMRRALRFPRYTAFGAAHRNGDVFCLSTRGAPRLNVADRAYFRLAVQRRRFAVGEYQLGRATRRPTLGLGYPVLDGGEVRGIVLAPLDLGWLGKRLGRARLPAGVEVVVVDHRGTILARLPEGAGRVGERVSDKPLLDALDRDSSGPYRSPTLSFTPVDGSDRRVWVMTRTRR